MWSVGVIGNEPLCVRLESVVEGVDIFMLNTGDRPELTDARLAGLDEVERSRAAAFRFPGLTQRYAATWSAARALLAARLDIAPDLVPIVRRCVACGASTHGKPLVDVRRVGRPIHFNVTHSAQRALVAIADVPVGVDLEEDDQAADPATLDAVSQVVLTAGERDAIAGLADQPFAQGRAVLRAWVRREAVVKALGVGLALAPDALPMTDADRLTVDGEVIRIADVHVPAGVAAVAWAKGPGHSALVTAM